MEEGAGRNRKKKGQLLPEHQKLQKKWQKLQSLRDKQKNHLKTAGECENEMQTLSKEWEEQRAQYETRFRVLSEKSGDSAAELENEIQNLQANEERRGTSASQSNGCCFDPVILEHLLAMEAAQAMQQLTYLQGEVSIEYLVVNNGQSQPLRNEEREQKRGKLGKMNGMMMRGWPIGGMRMPLMARARHIARSPLGKKTRKEVK